MKKVIQSIQGKRVAVLGFGEEGQAVTIFLCKLGVAPTVIDQHTASVTKHPLVQKHSITVLPDTGDWFIGFDMIFRSPGISRFRSDLVAAAKLGCIITSQTQLFFDQCPAQIVAVTGSKGKGTTVSLLERALNLTKKQKVFVTGNIGGTSPLLLLQKISARDIVIFEASSFQLEDARISPHLAIVLMISKDHLDYHGSPKKYVLAKANITKHQSRDDYVIYNTDYDSSRKIGEMSPGKKLLVSTNRKVKLGAYVSRNSFIFKTSNKEIVLEEPVLGLPGEHNYQNYLAAGLAGVLLGCTKQSITQAFATFTGHEHRLETVCKRRGLVFVNDSISTIPDSTIAAVQAYSDNIHLILGGRLKLPIRSYKEMFVALAKQKNLVQILLIGESTEVFFKELSKVKFSGKVVKLHTDFNAIPSYLPKTATSGVVLLSPAAASFDMFGNYKLRGKTFVQLAKKF